MGKRRGRGEGEKRGADDRTRLKRIVKEEGQSNRKEKREKEKKERERVMCMGR